MKNLLPTLIVVCCISILANPANIGEHIEKNTIDQLKKTATELELLQKRYEQLLIENSRLSKRIVNMQLKQQRLIRANDKLQNSLNKVKKTALSEVSYTAPYKLPLQPVDLVKENPKVKTVSLQKNCKDDAITNDKVCEKGSCSITELSCRNLEERFQQYSLKFVGQNIRQHYIENQMFKLAFSGSFRVMETKQIPNGVVVEIRCTNSSIPNLARTVVRNLAKKDIYAGVTDITAGKITMRVSPWSVYSS